MAGKDPFGCDPFAALHPAGGSGGAPPRPESPSPALPPKKSKQRPPRPAPPKMQPQLSPSPDPFSGGSPSPNPSSDPFSSEGDPFAGGGGGGNSGFADFSSFNSKFSEMTGKDGAPTKMPATQRPVADQTKLTSKYNVKSSASTFEFTEDPFRDYRYEDPFNIGDPFDDSTTDGAQTAFNKDVSSSKTEDPFGMKVSNGKTTPLPSEDQQLAWASAESLRMEEQRRKEEMKEIADLQLALAISKKEKPRNRVASGLKKILP